jgi:hypothetical protein
MQKILYIILGFAMFSPLGALAGTIAPSVETKIAKNITHNSAEIYASVAGGSAEDNGYWFEWGVVGVYDDVVFRTQRRTIGTNTSVRTVTATIRGLAPKTQYYFRIVADNQKSSSAGSVVYFTTRDLETPVTPVVLVTTRQVTSVRDDTAKVYGYVAPHGGSAEYWFDYGTDEKLTMHTSAQRASGNGVEVAVTLKALTPGTTYYYRIAAENDRGVAYGAIKNFKTAGEKPATETKTTQKVSQPTKATASSTPTKKSSESSGFSLFGKKTVEDKEISSVEKTPTKDALTGSVGSSLKDVSVSVKTLTTGGSKDAVEYRVSYVYNKTDAASKAELRITVPSTVVYIGDTTANELLVAEAGNGSKVYILPIGTIKKGDTRTVSIMTMKTGGATKTPLVDAKLLFTTKTGKLMTANALLASTGASTTGSSGLFPSTLILWVVAMNCIVAAGIFAVKAKEWYVRVQEQKQTDDTKSAATEKHIEETLAFHAQTPLPAFVSVASNDASQAVPNIPKKPKITDVYTPVHIQDVGLPGMEIIEDTKPQIQ